MKLFVTSLFGGLFAVAVALGVGAQGSFTFDDCEKDKDGASIAQQQLKAHTSLADHHKKDKDDGDGDEELLAGKDCEKDGEEVTPLFVDCGKDHDKKDKEELTLAGKDCEKDSDGELLA